MSTQRLLLKMCKGMNVSWSALSFLLGIIITCQLALPSVALAFQFSPTPTPKATSTAVATSTPQTIPQVPQDGAQTLAEVSVVRLVATYTGAAEQGPKPTFTSCTGLGVIIASWPVSSSSLTTTTWVLTDASVVNPAKAGCTAATNLGSIEVYANSFYTGPLAASTLPNAAMLGTFTCTTTCAVMQLATSSVCSTQCSGPVVFSFTTTHPQPFMRPAQNDLTPHLALALTDSQEQSPPAIKNAQVQNYLTPSAVSPTALGSSIATASTSIQSELGLPIINKEGQLVTIHLSSGSLDLTKLTTFLTTQTGSASHSNAVNTAWTQGITAFYGLNGQPKELNAAAAEFQAAHTANPDFQAATFMQQAAVKAVGSTQRTSPPTTPSSSSGFLGIPLWILAIIGLVVLLSIFVLISLSIGRKRAQQRQKLARFKADQAEAQRMAEVEVQRQHQTSAPGNRSNPSNQQVQAAHSFSTPQPSSKENELKVTPIKSHPALGIHCPKCGLAVPDTATFCPNCRYQLAHLPQSSQLAHLPQSSRSPLETSPVLELSMSNQIPKSTVAFQPSQEIVTEPIQNDLIVRETLRRLWDREGR